jgi:SAM-dependent methyltransferase
MNAKAMDNATGKRLLALIRDDDYAHPGEEEANRLLFAGLAPDPGRRILDAGCGGGGTAAWVQARGYGVVSGLEIDAETARLAHQRHPEVIVVEGDLQRAADVVPGPFDLVYSMTALYAVPHQDAVFAQLAAVAAPDAELRLLEYSDPNGRFTAAARGRSGREWWRPLVPGTLAGTLATAVRAAARGRSGRKWWRPLVPGTLAGTLATAGWSLHELRDLRLEFVRWYEGLERRIAAREDAIERDFGRDWYEFVSAEYHGLLDMVRRGDLGGLLVRATRA